MNTDTATIVPDPAAEAERIVSDFLAALERRDVAAAGALLATGVDITFPGGAKRASIEEVVAGSAGRYRHVGKSFERFDVLADGASTIVWCFGTLNGTFRDGTRFSGIRFVDRFEIRDGLIVRQDVWNDVAHVTAAGNGPGAGQPPNC